MSFKSIKNRAMLAAMATNALVPDKELDRRLASLGQLLMRLPESRRDAVYMEITQTVIDALTTPQSGL
jgi:hypothetical protein